MNSANWVALIQACAWPIIVLILALVFRPSILNLLSAIVKRMDTGAEVKTNWVTFGAVPSNLKAPKKDEPVTENHMALIHSSWRYPKKDAEFNKPMYCFDAVIQATDEVLDRIEYVRYSLHPSYPNPIQVVTDRKSRFKLIELAWGESTLRAEVKIKEQEKTILLSRYINLTQTGPRI